MLDSPFTIAFEEDETGLAVYIDERAGDLHLRPVQSDETAHYHHSLFTDDDVVKYWGAGTPIPESMTQSRIEHFAQLWKNNNPFSIFSVYRDADFSGEVHLTEIEDFYAPGIAEVGYAFAKKFQGQGIGTRAAKAVGIHYAQELYNRRAKAHGEPFSEMFATVHPENTNSERILRDKLSMEFEKNGTRFEHPRRFYRKKMG